MRTKSQKKILICNSHLFNSHKKPSTLNPLNPHKNDIKTFKLACVSFAIGTITQYKTILSLSLGAKSFYIPHSSVNITKWGPLCINVI